MREGPWYNDPPTSFNSCCALRDVATEFSCQGLELDFRLFVGGMILYGRLSGRVLRLPGRRLGILTVLE